MTEPEQVRLVHIAERSRGGPGGAPSPYRLGRHVQHDRRSLAYAAPVLPRSAILSQTWGRRAPVFDQGALGSCVGMAAAGWVATDTLTRPGVTRVGDAAVNSTWASEVLYHLATMLDEFDGTWRPEDTGSSGIGGAKALQSLGLCAGYTHAFTAQAALTALQSGPVLIGIPWYTSMWQPEASGQVRVDPASGLAGGHEVVVDRLDVDQDRVWVCNSWSTSWGLDGRAWLSLIDFGTLLADQGDVTIPTPVAVEPDPPAPAPPGCLGQLTAALRRRSR